MSGLRCAAVPVAVAPLVGLLWWALAPGGRSVVTDRLAVLETPAAQDAWFAALGAVAGLVLAVGWVAVRPAAPDAAVVRCLVALLGGCVAGSLVAWGTGVGVDRMVAAAAEGTADGAGLGVLGLASPAAVLVWPLIAALVVAADTARELIVSTVQRPAGGGAEPLPGAARPDLDARAVGGPPG